MFYLAAVCLIGACAAPQPSVRPKPVVVQSEPQSAEELLLAAGGLSGSAAARTYLRAADLHWQDARLADAEAALSAVDPGLLDLAGKRRYAELHVLLALEDGDMERAQTYLHETDFTPGEAAQVRARLCAAHGDYACAAEETMRGAIWTERPEALNPRIWQYLVEASRAGQANQAGATNETARGWWALLDLTAMPDPVLVQQRAFAGWQRTFPNHPANRALPEGLRYLIEPWATPRRIGVLLPLEGPLAAAGQAVRDGLIAAHLANTAEVKPTLTFHDTSDAPIGTVYEQALAAGAERIIGPLTRANAQALADMVRDVPVIALNRINPTAPAVTPPHGTTSLGTDFIQFALAIEDEAADVAHRLTADGHTRVLAVIAREAAWAQRAEAVLQTFPFEYLPVATAGNATQMTRAIGDAMLVSASIRRHTQLEQMLGETLEFAPRARMDLQAVAAFVDEVQAQALAPALRYHFADGLPVYVSSQALRGNRNLASLNGFNVTDLPMLIAPDENGASLAAAYALTPESAASLYALGADAYAIADRYQVMAGAGSRLRGQAGMLSIDRDGVVQRQQAWGTIVAGVLTPTNHAPAPQPLQRQSR